MLLKIASLNNGLARTRARSRIGILLFSLALIFLDATFILAAAVGQRLQNDVPAKPQQAESAALKVELRNRQQKLVSAKQSNDPGAIGEASRQVIALALRQMGGLKRIEGAGTEATEIYRRSLDFEDSPGTRAELSAVDQTANATASQRREAKAQEREMANTLSSALNDLGTAEARQQKFDLALAHFHEAEHWRADTPGLMRNIGLAAARLSDYSEAVRALRQVVTANPRDQLARSLLGTALYSTQNFAEAVRVFTPLGDSALREPELAYAWADSLIKTTQFPRATVLLDKLERQSLPSEMVVLIAQAWSQMGNYPRAVASCHKALQLDPKLFQAHFIAGMALIRSDHPAEAVFEFKSVLELDPGNNDAQYHLAFALLQLSRNDEAVELLRTVLTRDPDHPQANYELGRELLAEGKKDEAIKYLEAAARLNPQLDAVHYQLQSAYRALGRKEEADRELSIYRDMKAKNRNVNVQSPMGKPASD